MLQVLEIMKKHNVNIISVVTPSFMGRRETNRWRFESEQRITKILLKIWKDKGFDVLSIGKWPS